MLMLRRISTAAQPIRNSASCRCLQAASVGRVVLGASTRPTSTHLPTALAFVKASCDGDGAYDPCGRRFFMCFEVVDEEHSKTKIVLQLDTGMLWDASLFLLMGTHDRAYAHITDSSEADPRQRAPAVRSPKTQNTPKKCGVSNGEDTIKHITPHTPRHSCVFRQLANTKPVPFFRVQWKKPGPSNPPTATPWTISGPLSTCQRVRWLSVEFANLNLTRCISAVVGGDQKSHTAAQR